MSGAGSGGSGGGMIFAPSGTWALDALSRPIALGGPLAHSPVSLHQEFEARVLEELKSFGPTWIPVAGVKFGLDGSVKVMMQGIDCTGHFRKMSAKFTLPAILEWIGDPKAMAEIVFQVVVAKDPIKEAASYG